MKERPILFSGPMVLAILEGRKTQTRRVVKPQPDISALKKSARDIEFRRMPVLGPTHTPAEWGVCQKYDKPECVPIYCYKSPYGQPGDRLWVRETFTEKKVMPIEDRVPGDFVYRADLNEKWVSKWAAQWKPSIHMPRVASRITLEITGIRVERLQDISEADAIAEGLKSLTKDGNLFKWGLPDRDGLPGNDDYGWHWSGWCRDPRKAYRRLFESINGPDSWAANHWVWVVEFKRVNQ